MTLRPLSLLLLAALLPAQTTETTPAEKSFRDGWWAESGQNDLETALRLYLAAASAAGPATVKAKALVHAGAVQQRLGKAEAAMATLRQVLRDYPSEAESAEQARVHLRELTAVDLRQGYDEWYERRLFSEEVQVQILGKVEALAAALALRSSPAGKPSPQDQVQQAKAALLAYGKGAVPALRKTAELKHGALAEAAVDLLFQLDEVPPIAALQRCTDWASDVRAWSLLLRLPSERAASLASSVTSEAPHAALLRAALRGPDGLVQALASVEAPSLLRDAPETLGVATLALLGLGRPAARATLAALTSPDTPRSVRHAMESGLCDDEEQPDLSAADWLALGSEPTNFNLRFVCMQRATVRLGPNDGALLDEILRRLDTMPTARGEFVQYFCSGLQRHAAPQRLPWSAERLRFTLLAGAVDGAYLSDPLLALRWHDDGRALLASTLLADPAALRRAFQREDDADTGRGRLSDHFADNGSEHDMALLGTRWHAALASELTARWPGWSEEQRTAGLFVLRAVVREHGDRGPLLKFVGPQREAATGAFRTELDAAWEQFGGT